MTKEKHRYIPMQAAVLMSLLMLALLLGSCTKPDPAPSPSPSTQAKIGYAESAVALEDPDAFQKQVEEMYAKAEEGSIALEYKNNASSKDGTNFTCYIANSNSNSYDMFISIYGDVELSDELYLSQLLRPGTAFDKVALSKPLEEGEHTVYVAFTQVEEDLETIHAQVIVTLIFSVF